MTVGDLVIALQGIPDGTAVAVRQVSEDGQHTEWVPFAVADERQLHNDGGPQYLPDYRTVYIELPDSPMTGGGE